MQEKRVESDIEKELRYRRSRACALRTLRTRNDHELGPGLHVQARRAERGNCDSIPVRAYQLPRGSSYRRLGGPFRSCRDLRHVCRNSKTDPGIQPHPTLAFSIPRAEVRKTIVFKA